MYKQHEGILKEQMKDKEDKQNRKKMNTLELLYNKALMKAAASQDEHIKKGKIWFRLNAQTFVDDRMIWHIYFSKPSKDD